MLCVVTSMIAVPAKRQWRPYTLSNGETVEATLTGDEFGHWIETREGRYLRMRPDSMYEYVTQEEHTSILKSRQSAASRSITMRRGMTNTSLKSLGKDASITFEGDKRGLVIIAEFCDNALIESHTLDTFDDLFNKEGYDNDGHEGSVHDYFFDQSYGKFNLSFDIVGPIKVSQSVHYYGTNSNDGYNRDLHPGEFVSEVVSKADEEVDFSKYDWDNDGYVDQVYIIYAGYCEADGGSSDLLWPHEWSLDAAYYYYQDGLGPLMCDGTMIDTYAISSELLGDRGTKLSTVGTACHEFSHCLGLPDMYSTGEDDCIGMGYWDIMDQGCFNGPTGAGEAPPGYTAYERWIAGWMELDELTEECSVTSMPAIGDQPKAYIIYNDANRNEAYIIENRRPSKWFSYIYNEKTSERHIEGLLIYHIDYDEDIWYNNMINNDPKHQRLSYIRAAKGAFKWYEDYLFPGKSQIKQLGGTTTPKASFFNPNSKGNYYLEATIENISIDKIGFASFDYRPFSYTAIGNIKANAKESYTYDILGRKMRCDWSLPRGIYITKGKKVMTR